MLLTTPDVIRTLQRKLLPRPSKNQVIVFLRNMTKWIGSVYLGGNVPEFVERMS